MIRRSAATCLSLASLTATITAAGLADAQPSSGNRAEWRSLFNGKNLDGWKEIGNEKWLVVDGAIYGEGVTEEYGYLATEKEYTDFQLFLRFRCEAEGNSGVYFHTAFKPGTATVTQGRQIEIDRAVGNHTGGVYGDGKGWLVWPAPHLEPIVRPDDWNEMLIRVEGNRYVTVLNGVPMIDFTQPSPGSDRGAIALQLHSGGEGRMRFKDLWIRDLSHPR